MTTSKITKLEQQFKEGNKPSGFKISLADGTFGYLNEKESEKGIREGDDVFYEAVTPEGKNYKKISVFRTNGGQPPAGQSQQQNNAPVQPQRPQINVGAGKSIEECKVMCVIAVFDAVYGKMKEESDPIETLSINFKKITPLLYAEVDAIFARK